MDWKTHATSFWAQWIIRYMKPGEASWKQVMDYFLLRDARGKVKFPEHRWILACKLTAGERGKMLKRLPKKATYVRTCLKEYWKLGLTPVWDGWTDIGTESFWHGHRIKISAPYHVRQFCKLKLGIIYNSDIMSIDTNRVFKRADWGRFIREEYRKRTGVHPTNLYVIDWQDEVMRVIRQVPRAAKRAMRTAPAFPEDREPAYAGTADELHPGVYDEAGKCIELVWIDAVGVGHPTGRKMRLRPHHAVIKASNWGGAEDFRWAGPHTTAFPCDVVWRLGTEEMRFAEMTVKKMTQLRNFARMKPSPAPKAWKRRLGTSVGGMFRVKCFYTTPRDEVTWMKVWHRNLWVANRDPTLRDAQCNAQYGRRCTTEESMLHLATCHVIKKFFWDRVRRIMWRVGLEHSRNTSFIVAGKVKGRKYIGEEGAGMMFLAWRCLYAEVVKARLEDKRLDLENAYKRTIQMTISRLKAQGVKWYRWYSKTRYIQLQKRKPFPKRYRTRILIKTTRTAEFTINEELLKEYDKVK